MMYYQYIVPNPFYELKYDVTVNNQFFYDALVATIYPFTIYSHTIFPAPAINIGSDETLARASVWIGPLSTLDITKHFRDF